MAGLRVELIPTPLLSFDGSRGAILIIFNDQGKEVTLAAKGAEPNQVVARPLYSYHVLKMPGNGHVDLVSENGESFAFDVQFAPPRRFKVYLVPTVHTDWGFTATQDVVAEIHRKNTEMGLQLASRGVKWVAEVIYQMVGHMDDPAIREQNVRGYFGIQALPLNVLVGLCSHEELVRMLYPAAELKRKGYRIKVAALNDIPTAPWGLVTALTEAGIPYYIQASNPDRGPIHVNGNIRSPFYWVGPSSKKVLAWFSGGYDGLLFGFNGYHQGMSAGLLSDPSTAAAGIGLFTAQYENRGYPYEELLMYGMYLDNRLIDGKYAQILSDYSKEWVNPQVIVATPEEFFEEVEKKHGDDLPELSGDFGTYWEDGAGRSPREEAASLEAKRLLAAYEAMNAFNPAGAVLSARLWEDLVFWDEHTWGLGGVVNASSEELSKQWAVKSAFAVGPLAELKKALGDGFYFNPYPYPVEFYEEGIHYEVPPLSSVPKRTAETVSKPFPGFLEDDHYRLGFDGGKVVKIVDKDAGDVVFSAGAYSFDETVYVKGGKETRLDKTITNWIDFDGVREAVEGRDYVIYRESAKVEAYEEGPEVKRVKIRGTCGPVTVMKTIEIGSKKKEIRVKNEVVKPEVYDKEALYFAFPASLERPEVYVEEPGAFTNVGSELAPGACAGWFSTNGLVVVSGYPTGSRLLGRKTSVFIKSWDAPLVTVGDVNRGLWPSRVPVSGLIFSYVMNNYWFRNYYRASYGNSAAFSYSVTSFPASQQTFASAVRFLSKGVPVGSSIRDMGLEARGDVICTAIRRWSLGDGVFMRFLEVNGKSEEVELVAEKRWEFWETDATETPVKKLGTGKSLQLRAEPRSFLNVLLKSPSADL